MKIIFLDFDGVLNSESTWDAAEAGEILRIPDGPNRCLDVRNVPPLNEILRRSGAKIVISSSWRLFFTLDEICGFLKQLGVEGEVIGQTPRAGHDFARSVYGSQERGYEIQEWLNEHPEVIDFVILDDNSDMVHLLPKLVQTSDETGLSAEHIPLVLKQLGVDP